MLILAKALKFIYRYPSYKWDGNEVTNHCRSASANGLKAN